VQISKGGDTKAIDFIRLYMHFVAKVVNVNNLIKTKLRLLRIFWIIR